MRSFLFVLFFGSILSCTSQHQQLEELFSFPSKWEEISGMTYIASKEYLVVLEDKGNLPVLSTFSLKGEFLYQYTLRGVKNNDWEDLAQDSMDNLYIGDFGNNKNDRKNLAIYQIRIPDLQTDTTIDVTQTTTFFYPEQKDFPPQKSELYYDCEAFIATSDYFYLFTKNRSKGFDGTFFVYRIPNKQGHFKAERTATLTSCKKYKDCAITGAALHESSNQVVLNTHSQLLVFPFRTDGKFDSSTLQRINLHHSSQKEAVAFKDAHTIFLSDEKQKGTNKGGKLYKFELPKNDNPIQN